ncbi:unnamed protein product [Prunus armeniaca]
MAVGCHFYSHLSEFASASLLIRGQRPTLRGFPILPDVFAGTFIGLSSDKHSCYDDLLLEVRQAKMAILLPPTLSIRGLD